MFSKHPLSAYPIPHTDTLDTMENPDMEAHTTPSPQFTSFQSSQRNRMYIADCNCVQNVAHAWKKKYVHKVKWGGREPRYRVKDESGR